MSENEAQRWKIILVDRMVFFRKPKSKKFRIVKKWRKRPENWRPDMRPWAVTTILGSEAIRRATQPISHHLQILEMHTNLWLKIQTEKPDFARRCDVFRRQKTMKNGIPWMEEVPVTPITSVTTT